MIRSMKSLAGLALLSFAAINIYAQGNATSKTAGVGIPFGSRDPRPCADLTGSVLTQQKALSSFICSDEQLGQTYLKLIENASLQLGNPRAYNFKEDYNLPNIDLAAKVYPIRGSFREYSCVRFRITCRTVEGTARSTIIPMPPASVTKIPGEAGAAPWAT